MDSTSDTPKAFSYDRDPSSLASQLVASTEAAHKTVTAPATVTVRGINLTVTPGVFNPAHSNVGDLLAEYLSTQINLNTRVLDMGTGSGFQALCAAQKSSSVWACDKQTEAVQCAKENILRNNAAERITVLASDLFDSIPGGTEFDVILFNMPFVPWKPETDWQRCNFDFKHELLFRFLSEARNYLAAHGRIFLTFSDIGNLAALEDAATQFGYKATVVSSRVAKGIGHYVFELKKP